MATIEKKGSGRWRARIRRTGQPELSRTFTSKAQAKLWARHTEADLDRGLAAGNGHTETPAPAAAALATAPLQGPSDDTTLGELIALYRDAVTPDHRGAESERIRINRWLRDVRDGGHPLRDHALSAITRQQVQAWMTTRLKTVKPDTIRREVTLLQQIVSHAIRDWGYEDLAANPFQQARKPKAGRGRVRRLAKDEEHYLQRALDPEASLPAGIRPARSDDLLFLFTFAIETTMRRSELLRVRWENVDLEVTGPITPSARRLIKPVLSLPSATAAAQRSRLRSGPPAGG